jgi:hypothetical protein
MSFDSDAFETEPMNAFVFAVMRAFQGKLPKPPEKEQKTPKSNVPAADAAQHESSSDTSKKTDE